MFVIVAFDYTTTRENRELRLKGVITFFGSDYTTTRENRELRPVYQLDGNTYQLYHYERKQGTTTFDFFSFRFY